MIQEITNIFHRPRHKPAKKILQHAKRSNDAIIIIRQDNVLKKLQIEALNLLAIKMLGYENEEIVENELSLILPDDIIKLVEEDLEFSNNGNSIDVVLNRISDFKIKTKDNVEIPVRIKIIRSLCIAQVTRFQIVLNDSSLMQSLEANRTAYRAKMRGDEVYDKKTALLTKTSILKDIELIASYSERSLKESCFVIYGFGNYTALRHEHGEDGAFNMVKSLAKTIETNKRGNDIVGILDNAVIVILPETPHDNIKLAIARIYSKFPQEIKSELKIQYDAIKSHIPAETQLDNALKSKSGTF